MHKRSKQGEWVKSQHKQNGLRSHSPTTSGPLNPSFHVTITARETEGDRDRPTKDLEGQGRKRKSHTRFLGLPLLICLQLVINLFPVQGLGFVRLLQAVPHHSRTSVGIGDVCHPCIPPVWSCCSSCCSWHCQPPSKLLLLLLSIHWAAKPTPCNFSCSIWSRRVDDEQAIWAWLQTLKQNNPQAHCSLKGFGP